uniref:Uncharacterized protein n=1 Tax=Solanum tuberosum TaxID=4113 RepID=M1B016_SOLTU
MIHLSNAFLQILQGAFSIIAIIQTQRILHISHTGRYCQQETAFKKMNNQSKSP